MTRYVMVDVNTNQVENVIRWDGESQYIVQDNYILIQSDVASIGNIYNPTTREFVNSEVIPTPITELTPQEKLAQAGLTVDELKTLLGL